MFFLLVLLFGDLWETRRYDGATSPYVESSMKEMLRARQCLPDFVGSMMDSWLQHLTVLEHHRFLTTVGLQKLIQTMENGIPLCQAMKPMLKRMLHRHVDTLARHTAMLEPGHVVGPGWDETSVRMGAALTEVEDLCKGKVTGKEDQGQILTCMKAVEKSSKRKHLLHYFGE